MKDNKLTLGSLFDGSGGFPLGGMFAGITPLWASEIEPFPIRVTTKRMPWMKHYGDVSKINGADLEPVDIITFGSPCQDMSVAGKRNGLSGKRSGLFYEAMRIIKEMRDNTDGKYPRFIVWENVPGAFSSNKGEDFRAVLEEICKIKDQSVSVPGPQKWGRSGCIMGNGYSIAWRQFDAQFWGVPQRRKRIYLVADFAGGGAGEILFESEGLSGYSAESFRTWQRASRFIESRSGVANCNDATVDKSNAISLENHPNDSRVKVSNDGKVQSLTSRMGTGGGNVLMIMDCMSDNTDHASSNRGQLEPPNYDETCIDPESARSGSDLRHIVLNDQGGSSINIENDLSQTLRAESHQHLPIVLDSNKNTCKEIKAYGACSKNSNCMKLSNPHSGFYEADTSRTLDLNGGTPSCNQGGIVVIEGNGSRPSHKGDGYKQSDVMYTLNATEQHALALSDDINNDDHGVVYSMATGKFRDVAVETSVVLKERDYKDPNIVIYEVKDNKDNASQKSYGFCSGNSSSERSIGYQEEKSPTLKGNGGQKSVVLTPIIYGK